MKLCFYKRKKKKKICLPACNEAVGVEETSEVERCVVYRAKSLERERDVCLIINSLERKDRTVQEDNVTG